MLQWGYSFRIVPFSRTSVVEMKRSDSSLVNEQCSSVHVKKNKVDSVVDRSTTSLPWSMKDIRSTKTNFGAHIVSEYKYHKIALISDALSVSRRWNRQPRTKEEWTRYEEDDELSSQRRAIVCDILRDIKWNLMYDFLYHYYYD